MVTLRGPYEIEGLRLAGDLVARTLEMLSTRVRPGIGLDELDRSVEEFLFAHGAESPYRGYRPSPSVPPFPGNVCASVNEQVVHGIPSRRKLRVGDIVGIDVGAVLGGWIGDACYTYAVGEVSPQARRLLDVSRECLEAGVVRELGGHGVGRKLHEEPHVEHFGRRGHGLRLREGMVFTIKPMINEGSPGIRLLGDGWTVVTGDGRPSAQYEHTVAVTDAGCEILTPWHRYVNEGAASAREASP